MPLAAALFLLAQLLVSFHHHSDAETKRGDGHLPAAECTLCLAAHLPFDIAHEVKFTVPGAFVASRLSFSAISATLAPAATRHTPRAPPRYSR